MPVYVNTGNGVAERDQLFVYGIFLSERNQQDYGMSNPEYDVVADFVTVGGYIAQAVPVEPGTGVILTGLVVEVDPQYWKEIDNLEAGYERIIVNTNAHGQAHMYVAPGSLSVLEEEEQRESKDSPA